MPPARIEMMQDVREPCATIATHEEPKALQLLAHGVFAAGKEVNGQCAPYRAKAAGIGQFRSGGQEGLHRGRLECSKTKRVAHESVRDVGIAAQPIKWRSGRQEGGVEEGFCRLCGPAKLCKPGEQAGPPNNQA